MGFGAPYKMQKIKQACEGSISEVFNRQEDFVIRPIIQAGLVAFIFVTALYTGAVAAHGKVTMEDDSCMRRIGDNIIHFNAYQPQNDKTAQYCTEIPETGDTVLVVDLVDPALRNMPIGIKIIKGTNSTDGETIKSIRPVLYEDGVINTLTFLDQGEYVISITAEGLPPLKYHYQLRVKMVNYEEVFRAAIGPLVGLIVMIILGYKLMKSKRMKGWIASRRSKVPE